MLPALIAVLPVLLFLLVQLTGTRDFSAWLLGWYYRGFFHYYTVYLVSFMALVVSLGDRAMLAEEGEPRALLLTLGFSAMATFSFLSSLSLHGVFAPGSVNPDFSWSSRLVLPIGGLFFALAGIPWKVGPVLRAATRRPLMWIGLLVVVCTGLALAIAPAMPALSSGSSRCQWILATTSILLLLWAAVASWMRYRRNSSRFEKSMALVMALLAEAEIFQAIEGSAGASWWLYQVLVLAALTIALRVRLIAVANSRDFRPSRYFFILGSILILGLSLLSGELGTQLFKSGSDRLSMVSLAIAHGAFAFLLLYFVVRHLDRLFRQRLTTLESEQDLRTELTQMIVHDLKNPLTVLRGGIEMLERGILGPLTQEQAGALKLVSQSSQKVSGLIQDMVDIHWLEEGLLRPNPVGIDPHELLRESAENVSALAERNQIGIAVSLPDTLPYVYADRELLSRVVYNLLANAVRFAPHGGEIGLSADANETMLALCVVDNGPGVPKRDRERIFELPGATRAMTRRGRGMSLAFCRMVCEAHGGAISVNDNPGGGALFKVTLPITGLAPAPGNGARR